MASTRPGESMTAERYDIVALELCISWWIADGGHAAGAATINYGSSSNGILDFIIVAFAIS
jgi:large-conductance mechanosensitive channel